MDRPSTFTSELSAPATEDYRAGLDAASRALRSRKRPAILDTNPGMWFVIAARRPGPNSCSRFIPASLPNVEPTSLSGAEFDRAQYGREALWTATDVSTATKYDVLILRLPDSSVVTKILEAASVARPIKLSLDEA
jgi:hypothetical protein